MSEVEKLYENAEINKIGIKRCSGIKQGICQHNCNECENFDYKYPPFTAEKQIRILKLLCQRRFIELGVTADDEYFLYNYDRCQSYNQDFEEAIAEFVNVLWQDLTEEEKQQVKGILE